MLTIMKTIHIAAISLRFFLIFFFHNFYISTRAYDLKNTKQLSFVQYSLHNPVYLYRRASTISLKSRGHATNNVFSAFMLTYGGFLRRPCWRYRSTSSTQRFDSRNICSEGQTRLIHSVLIPVKTRDFFDETSPRTFVTSGLVYSFLSFSEGQYVVDMCKLKSANASRKTRRIGFCFLKFSAA